MRSIVRSSSFVVAAVSVLVAASPARAEAPACACVADFDRLSARLEADYVGFALGYAAPDRRAAYDLQKREARREAAAAGDERCVFALRRLTDWFHDGHLFVQEAPEVDAGEARRRAAASEVISLSESEMRQRWSRDPAGLDPIEGIWFARDGDRVGVIRDPKPGRREFVGVLLTTRAPGWRPGQVKAEFSRRADGTYDAVLYTESHVPRHPTTGRPRLAGAGADISRGLLLEMPADTWGKEFPLRDRDRGGLDPRDPRAPTLRLVERAVVISIPSHSPEYADRLAGLVAANRERILAAEPLILDLRGDEGGSSGSTSVLLPFLATRARRGAVSSLPDDPVVLSSPDNLAYFRAMGPQGWIPEHLVERMAAAPGKVVSFVDPAPASPARAEPEPEELPGPRRVAILVDGGVVSAGEAFLLQALPSTKVRVYGESTAGVIDYQNVTLVRLACPRRGLLFGYPTLAASPTLPAGGLNGVGIPPDVPIGPDDGDPIAFILRHEAAAAPDPTPQAPPSR